MYDRQVMPLLLLVNLVVGCGSASPAGSDGGHHRPQDGAIPALDSGVPADSAPPGIDSGTSSGGFACTTGTLLSGYPEHDSVEGVHANEGDPLRGVEGRPLGWRELAFVGERIVTIVGQEVWTSDLGAAAPTVHRIAGVDSTSQSLLDGPCAGARFANLQDVAVDSEGSLYVMDQTGNAVLKITDPFDDAACAVHFWAGTSADTTGITPDTPPNVGEVDGPGADARFALPSRMAIDDADNLYVWDAGNASVRKIANDASHTVSTLTELDSADVIVDSMVVLHGVLYLFQHETAGETFLQSVDLASGAKADVLRGRADVFGFSSSDSLQNGGMATDGVDLFVYFKGLVFLVTIYGEVTHVAGDEGARSTIEFDVGYDPAVPHAALDLQLATRDQFATAGAGSWLGIDARGDLYFVGSVSDPYVEKIECGR